MKTSKFRESVKGYFLIVCVLLCLVFILGSVIPYGQKVSVSGEAVWVSSSGAYIKEDHYVIEGEISGYLIPIKREKRFEGTIQIDSLDFTKEYPLMGFTYWEKGYLNYMDLTGGEDGFFQTIGPVYMDDFPEEAVIIESLENGEFVYIVLGTSAVEEADQKIQEIMR